MEKSKISGKKSSQTKNYIEYYLMRIILLIPGIVLLFAIFSNPAKFQVGDCIKGGYYKYKITKVTPHMYRYTDGTRSYEQKRIVVERSFKKVACAK